MTWQKTLAVASIIIILMLLSGCIGIKSEEPNNTAPVKYASKKVGDKTINITIDPNDKVAPSRISYLIADRGSNWINWTWENPLEKDYSHAIIYIDGKFKKNLSDPVNFYNLTRLKYDTQYRIGIRTVDFAQNVNTEWVNISVSTLPKPVDKLYPDTVWYLEYTAGSTWINWTWENPSDSDYSYANVWIDGMFAANVSKTRNYYLKTGFAQDSEHLISIRTVDINKNMNPKEVIGNATTTLREPDDITPPGTITNLQSEADTTWIRWWWTNPDDSDYSYANVYVDGVFAANVTKPNNFYKKINLLPNTEHIISVRTVDASKNVNIDTVSDSRNTRPG